MVDPVKALLQIDIDDPLVALGNIIFGLMHGLVGIAAGPEPKNCDPRILGRISALTLEEGLAG